MFRILADHRRPNGGLSRREWLRLSGLAGLGIAGLPLLGSRSSWSASPESAAKKIPGFGRAKSVILVYASGGQSQLEMWDPKPDAPDGIRGEFAAIQSSAPGVLLGEHTPRLARLADRYTIVRSVHHDDLDHGTATYLAMTGRFHAQKSANPPPRPNDEPTFGAIVKRARPTDRFLYDAVHINGPLLSPTNPAPGLYAGQLGHEYEPLLLGDVSRGTIAVPGLDPEPELPPLRLAARQNLKQALDRYCATVGEDRRLQEMNHLYSQAFEMLSSSRCRQAFDLSAEPVALRDRYGRNRSGQACLLARRLVEAGVPLITVIWSHSNRGQDKDPDSTDAYGWDTHNDIFDALKTHLLPRFDLGFSALLEDLDQRGLLDDTLVVCMGEFGRAPKIALEAKFAGTSPGRKHWASVYSIVMAGAGVSRGAVYGQSDKIAGQPAADPVTPCDVAATIFSALGIDPGGHYTDTLGRPFPISVGRPIGGLYAG